MPPYEDYKTKGIRKSVYEKLLQYSLPDESFSDIIARILEYAVQHGLPQTYIGNSSTTCKS